PEKVEEQTGIAANRIRTVAKELTGHRGKSIVLGGALHAKNGLMLQIVANLINTALSNDGATIDYSQSPSRQIQSSYADLVAMIDTMNQGRVGGLVIYKTNPVLSLNGALDF